MPTPTKGARLGGSPAHQRLILANLASQLFTHGRITTTEAKAKRLRPYAEKLITLGKKGDLHSRRIAAKKISSVDGKTILHILFTDIAPRYENRNGGYTRIVKLNPRKGDNAPMALIELVEPLAEAVVAEATAATKRAVKEKAAAPAAAPVEAVEEVVEAPAVEEVVAEEVAVEATEEAATEAPAEEAAEDSEKA